MSSLPYRVDQLSGGREYPGNVKVIICNEDIPCYIQTEEARTIHQTILSLSDDRA